MTPSLLWSIKFSRSNNSTRVEQPKKFVYQEPDGTDHTKVFSRFACGRQRRLLVKSQAN